MLNTGLLNTVMEVHAGNLTSYIDAEQPNMIHLIEKVYECI